MELTRTWLTMGKYFELSILTLFGFGSDPHNSLIMVSRALLLALVALLGAADAYSPRKCLAITTTCVQH